MKKVLLVLALGALMFSCAKDEVSTSKNEGKITSGIVDPHDYDMENYPTANPLLHYYNFTDPDRYYGKEYLFLNLTQDSIRVNVYSFPKFSLVAQDISLKEAGQDESMVFEFIYPPNLESVGTNYNAYMQNNIITDKHSVQELWDHMYSGPKPAYNPYWIKYTTNYLMDKINLYKPTFIEFWVKNGDYEGEHFWLSVETDKSYKISMAVNPYNNFPASPITIPSAVSNVEFYGLENELPSLNPYPWNLYYFIPGVHNTAYDKQHNVQGTFRYMPNVVTPNYPHFNPDNTPGYIIKFENL
ncbi:MAG: hypothetical protein LBE34_12570 [Flavobacteriaceae bacterium]|jgi:hypothetical protein|nr:hypothetical protein [Flavobacteriaceae bacterium]